MSYSSRYRPNSISQAGVLDRVTFIRKTYTHLAGAIGLFVLFSYFFYSSGISNAFLQAIANAPLAWLLVLGGFAVVGYLAQAMARADRPLGTQYFGLGLYTLAEAFIFGPLILLAVAKTGPGGQYILPDAAIVTLCTFAGLTGYVLLYNKDFSYLGGFITAALFTALGVIIVGALFGFNLGVWFSGAMIIIAALAILNSTSRIMLYYRSDQYVAAALELFAAIALLFWYVLRIFLQLNRR